MKSMPPPAQSFPAKKTATTDLPPVALPLDKILGPQSNLGLHVGAVGDMLMKKAEGVVMQKKITDYLVLVNGENPLPEGYEDTVERIWVENSFGDQYQVEKKTYEAFLGLQKDLLENDGIAVELISAYRTVEAQTNTYNHHMEKFGPEHTNKYVARPGHSEHHTGIAIDVGVVVDGALCRYAAKLLELGDLYRTIQAKLPQYGFILRYPRGKEPITKIGYECWHFRYLDSPALAKEITGKGWCFEEYWANK